VQIGQNWVLPEHLLNHVAMPGSPYLFQHFRSTTDEHPPSSARILGWFKNNFVMSQYPFFDHLWLHATTVTSVHATMVLKEGIDYTVVGTQQKAKNRLVVVYFCICRIVEPWLKERVVDVLWQVVPGHNSIGARIGDVPSRIAIAGQPSTNFQIVLCHFSKIAVKIVKDSPDLAAIASPYLAKLQLFVYSIQPGQEHGPTPWSG
jgi:hypothetical protein